MEEATPYKKVVEALTAQGYTYSTTYRDGAELFHGPGAFSPSIILLPVDDGVQVTLSNMTSTSGAFSQFPGVWEILRTRGAFNKNLEPRDEDARALKERFRIPTLQ